MRQHSNLCTCSSAEKIYSINACHVHDQNFALLIERIQPKRAINITSIFFTYLPR
ncbi:MAG: hypothetical protein AVDCRST_MAG96-593 [uncultured Segetibacter sp.]|uniref:Uncharacterized protein n=1 Tax=uncultured Segetibacter sp. TaxID=481133 RepID=A0A6J4RHR8_9BACT|nr:MAG: hypothetical protein AVDCRST_MAG96-593 [uncultured Segetibacter sp.]